MNIIADEGYYFGLGAFETIAVENGRPQLLKEHYNRLQKAMDFFKIETESGKIQKMAEEALAKEEMQTGRKVLKIAVSKENIVVTTRENTYTDEHYRIGFITDLSKIRRNETSPMTYHKTFNYGDCILEKRAAKKRNIDEPLFLNTRGELAEGATSNIFLVKNNKIYTPPVSCGMLPGIMREYICSHFDVEEKIIFSEEIREFDEMFFE